MKWVILTGFLLLLGRSHGNVLRCSSDDGECTKEEEKVTVKPEVPAAAGKSCAIGSTWRSDCQDCVCAGAGHAVCNATACLENNESEYSECAPNSTWRDDCNNCYCYNGRGVCTKIGCIHFEDNGNTQSEKKAEEILIAEPAEINDAIDEPNQELLHNVLKRSVCKPSQQFQNECNSCQCAADGQSYTCTQAECLERDMTKEVEVFMESEGVDHIERHSVCKPADTFYIGCNTCHCNYDGTDFSCTNKPCPLPDDVELFHELNLLALKKQPAEKSNQTCKAKAMFIKDCNICWCNEYGTDYFCTRKVCIHELPDEPPVETPEEFRIIKKECRPDEVFELDCNMCRCNPDGKSFSCTRRACLDLEDKVEELEDDAKISLSRKVRATPQELPKACQPGQEFRLDCNKCLCDNEGLAFSCTRIDCVAAQNGGNTRTKRDATSDLIEIETTCTPGGVFNAECNACRCSDDGRSAKCTRAQCTPNHLDSEVKEPEPDPGFRCNPGEQFKKDCNDCTCSADGRSTFCTLRLCDESLPQNLSP